MGLGNAVKKWGYLGIFTVKQLIFLGLLSLKILSLKYIILHPLLN